MEFAQSSLAEQKAPVTHLTSRFVAGKPDVEPVIKIDLEAEKVRSHIAEGDEFVGDLKCATGVRISGRVQGSINCTTGAVVVERTGFVSGSISGNEKIFIDGNVGMEDGSDRVKVTSPGMIVLMDGANVHADIEYGKLSTYGDMSHNGNSRKIPASR